MVGNVLLMVLVMLCGLLILGLLAALWLHIDSRRE